MGGTIHEKRYNLPNLTPRAPHPVRGGHLRGSTKRRAASARLDLIYISDIYISDTAFQISGGVI
jgi:hypothetical protein